MTHRLTTAALAAARRRGARVATRALATLALAMVTGCGDRPSDPTASSATGTSSASAPGKGSSAASHGPLPGASAAARGGGHLKWVVETPKSARLGVYQPLFNKPDYLGHVLIDGFDRDLAWPRDVRVVYKECGEVNSAYRKSEAALRMCYELADFFTLLYAKDPGGSAAAQKLAANVTIFTELHELGHGIIGELDLGVAGGEEQAVDDFATVTLIDKKHPDIAVDGAVALAKLSEGEKVRPQYFDEHPLGEQRWYNILCLVYASDEKRYARYVRTDPADPAQTRRLPKGRAAGCAEELAKKSKFWREAVRLHRRP